MSLGTRISAGCAAALVAAGLAVSACSPGAEFTMREQLLQACQAYAGTLQTLAALRAAGKLSEEQINEVNSWRKFGNAACGTSFGNLESPRHALDRVETALFHLQGIETDVRN